MNINPDISNMGEFQLFDGETVHIFRKVVLTFPATMINIDLVLNPPITIEEDVIDYEI
jgi:hypothetical protein